MGAQVCDSSVTLVRCGEELPLAWERSVLLHWLPGTVDYWGHWRDALVDHLETAGFSGVVFVADPPRRARSGKHVKHQLRWLAEVSRLADVSACYWSPSTSSAETLNWLLSSELREVRKVVLEIPDGLELCDGGRELHAAQRLLITHSVQASAQEIVQLLQIGALRRGPERAVPLDVWLTPEFQHWLSVQLSQGNRLNWARPVWAYRPGRGYAEALWYWALHASVYVATEQRAKSNEVLIGRPDIAAIVLYNRAEPGTDLRVVLVREYRTPTVNEEGYVWELPSGSGSAGQSLIEVAVEECREEVGVELEKSRLRSHGARQLMSTMSCHRSHVFSAELTAHESSQVQITTGLARGSHPNERVFAELVPSRTIVHEHRLDWSMTGMLSLVLSDLGQSQSD
jgi:8-oxo-dGTP pyrophosphatase MutT (NUDIX family)